jgi:hypothetical protein
MHYARAARADAWVLTHLHLDVKTSYDVQELGLYASDCCGEELIFDAGDTFTRCPKCEGLCTWEFEHTLVRPSETRDRGPVSRLSHMAVTTKESF